MYVELANGAVQNRGVVVKTTLLPDLAWNAKGEMYNSYYQFDAELIEHFKIRKTIRGYRGKYYLINPIVDLDKGTDSDEFILERVKRFLERLDNDFDINPILNRVYFSGRGYHIVLPNIFNFKACNELPTIVKNVMEKYFPEGDTIYDGARLIRTPQTLNAKSNMYKIPLQSEDIFNLTWQEIHKRAGQRVTKYDLPDITEYTIPNHSKLIEIENTKVVVHSEVEETTNIVTCIQKMYNEGPIESTRHHKLLRMATSWRRAGIPKEGIISMISSWATNLEPYEIRRTVNDVFDKGYHPFKCSDNLMTKYCDSKCIFYKNKNYTTEVINSIDAEKAYIKYINSNLEQRAFDFNEIFKCASYKCYPGEAIVLIGDTKLGKSTIMQNIAVKLTGRKILFLPLENMQHLAYRRFIQIAHKMSKEEVDEHYRIEKNGLSQAISHIHMVVLPPTIQDLRKLVIEHKPDILIIDTLDGIDIPNVYDDTIKTSMLGPELKQIAQQLDLIVFAVAHISKSAAVDINGKAKPMNIHSAKGSTAVPQKFDKILAWEGDRKGVQRYLTSLGARDEEDIRLTFNFNYVTFQMEQLGV